MTACNCHSGHHERGTHAPTTLPRQDGPAHPHVSDGGREKRPGAGSITEGAALPPASPARTTGAALYLYAVVPTFAVAFLAAAVWALTG